VRALLCALIAAVPCFWHARIQAGDFSSHVYNAWLASLIPRGQAPGLFLSSPRTNVLFDLLYQPLFQGLGLDLSSRIAVVALVVVFVFGALRLLRQAASDRAVTGLFPMVLMFAYGWTFHMGFLNFYLSLGLTLWAIAQIWKDLTRRNILIASSLLLLASTAHTLPVVWGLCSWAFVQAASRLTVRHRLLLTAATILSSAVFFTGLTRALSGTWQWPVVPIVPADQFWIYGFKYYPLAIAATALWACMLLRLSHEKGGFLTQPISLLFGVTLAAIFMLPRDFAMDGVSIPLSLIQERMTLPLGLVLLMVLGQVPPVRWQAWAAAMLALIFFSFLYVDSTRLNDLETRMETLLKPLPSGSRVVATIDDPGIRSWALVQLAARACIGKCWYYSNYEPMSGAFRVRCRPDNLISVCGREDQEALANGGYLVKPREAPIHELTLCGDGLEALCLKQVAAGERTSPKRQVPQVLPRWWK
jgi:hypothetical protein